MDTYVTGELSLLTVTDSNNNEFKTFECQVEEALSSCYSIRLVVSRVSMSPADYLGQELTLNWSQVVAGSPNNLLTYHGFATDIQELEVYNEDQSSYALTLRPWFWLLKFNQTNRIFQNQTVKDILTSIFDDAGFKGKYKFGAMPSSQSEYCTQLNETDLAFAQRIMFANGIVYYFEQTDTDHILHIQSADTAFSNNSLATFEHEQTRDGSQFVLNSWKPKHKLVSQTLDGYDYSYEKSTVNTSSIAKTAQPLTLYKNQRFQLAASIPTDKLPDSKRADNLTDQMTIISKAQEADFQVIQAKTDANVLTVGGTMTLSSYPNTDYQGDYNVIKVVHRFDFSQQANHQPYVCEFECKDTAIALHSPVISKPVSMGITNAVVVSDSGDSSDAGAISQDKYGRVKVHFCWDTQQSDSVSCYLRVMQQSAGSIATQQFIPRINQEVIVDYINGDIDKPIIIGSVYNDNNPALFAEKDTPLSGIKTGLAEETSHQITFDDTKDSEKLSILSGKDYELTVANDAVTTINANDTLNITQTQTTKIEDSQTINVTNDHSLNADNITLEADTQLILKVGSNQIVIDSSGVEITGDAITISSSQDTQISAMNFKTSSNAATEIKATSNLDLSATAQANLEGTAGVNVKSTAMAKVQGTAGTEISSTAMTKVSGVAMTQIEGALVKIN